MWRIVFNILRSYSYRQYDIEFCVCFQVGFDGHYARIREPFRAYPLTERQTRARAPFRHQAAERHRLLLEEGEIKSFLTDIFPECKPLKLVKKEKSE